MPVGIETTVQLEHLLSHNDVLVTRIAIS